ncbi:MAG: diguanylate cyclase [Bdellovibrionales bacterium]|nr:diguanylate cyclase [Bdellovibrionales bacterium]
MDSSNPKFLEVTATHTGDGFDNSQGDLIRSLKREIKGLKGKVTAQDIRIFEMQALLQSGKGLSNILNLPHLLDTFMAVVRERYDLTNSSVLLKEDFENGEKEHFQVMRYFGLEDHYIDSMGRKEPLYLFRIEKNNGLLWQLIQQGNVFSVRDLQKEPRFTTAWEKLGLDVLRSDFWCPLIKSGEVIGVLTLGERRDGTQISETDYSFVQELASLATTIIDSTLRYEKNQRILNNIQILYDFHQELSTINDFKLLCRETIRNAVKAVKAQKGNLMLLNRQTGKLELTVAWGYIDENVLEGLNSGRIETKSFDIGEGIAGQSALQRKSVVVNNRDDIPQMGSFETYCICSVPVLNGGQLEGIMNFTNKVHIEKDGSAVLDTLGRFTREDLSLLQGIADQSAVSLHKSRLYSASITDRLTGLNNSRHFEDTFYELAAKAVVEDKPLSLVICDIDHFKQFNDKHGHKAGDFILKSVASVFMDLRRQGHQDQAYRYGGEEFCLVMPETTAEEAILLLEEFREKIAKKDFVYENLNLKVTVSVGISQTGLHTKDPRALFNMADDAMYECKRNGRNQVRIAKLVPPTSTDSDKDSGEKQVG